MLPGNACASGGPPSTVTMLVEEASRAPARVAMSAGQTLSVVRVVPAIAMNVLNVFLSILSARCAVARVRHVNSSAPPSVAMPPSAPTFVG